MLNRGEEARSARAFVPYLSHGRLVRLGIWLRGRDLNPRPLGYEPNELPDCSTPRQEEDHLTIPSARYQPPPKISDITSLGRPSRRA